MSGAGLGWSIFGASLVVGLLLTRPFYGRIRAFCIDDAAREGYKDPIGQAHNKDHGFIVGLTALACFLWPLGFLSIYCGPGLMNYAKGTKHKSRFELAQQAKNDQAKLDILDKKIKDLERWNDSWRDMP